MKGTVIELDGVGKTYMMDEVAVHALKNVDLKIKRREFVAIMGPSGSGKSTLLHMVGVLDRPTAGRVRLDGMNISELDDAQLSRLRGRKIGFIFQFFNLHPTLTARENVELPMLILERGRDERAKRSAELLKMVGMENRMNHLPSQLSGGERQRVAVCRALANDPPLLLADEPTGNLDSKSGEEVMDLLSGLVKEKKVTVVMVTHDNHIADRAERLVVLKDGEIVEDKARGKVVIWK
ncbi:MAG: ABC transporter ATP-binding protein [Candidatus Aenigmatarchaeota archaeon]